MLTHWVKLAMPSFQNPPRPGATSVGVGRAQTPAAPSADNQSGYFPMIIITASVIKEATIATYANHLRLTVLRRRLSTYFSLSKCLFILSYEFSSLPISDEVKAASIAKKGIMMTRYLVVVIGPMTIASRIMHNKGQSIKSRVRHLSVRDNLCTAFKNPNATNK